MKWIRNTPTASRQWHDLKIRIDGNKVEGYLDGKLYLQDTLAQPVSGRIGLWSKADSYMHFTDYTVTDPARLKRVLAQVRRDGVAVSDRQVTDDAVSVAAPITDSRGEVVAALSVVATVGETVAARLAPAVRAAARGTSRALSARRQ